MRILKINTAVSEIIGPFVDVSDAVTPETALIASDLVAQLFHGTTANTLSLTSTTFVHVANGFYRLDLVASDTNTASPIIVSIMESDTCLPVWQDYRTMPANIYDSMYAGTDYLQVDDNSGNAIATSAAVAAIDITAADITGGVTVSELQTYGASWVTATGFSTHSAADVWSVATRTITTTIPTAANVADAVWDEAMSGHVSVGTAGIYLSDASEGGVATVSTADKQSIADYVWNELVSDHTTDGSFGQYVSDIDTLGRGATTKTYTLTDSVSGNPIGDAEVWITTDIAGNHVIASGRTDANGQVTFYLDSGTYYLWRQHTDYTFSNPDTETVS